MRKLLFALVPVVVVLALGCSGKPGDPIAPVILAGNGTIRYESLEGGFWQVELPSGKRYEAYVIPEALKVEGLRVAYVGRLRTDLVTAHMTGPLLELESITTLAD
jgi:hypothetical protein